MERPEISVVIPVYNSAHCLEELYRQISASLQNSKYELILINDKSKDESWNIILSLSRRSERVKGISLRKNAGQDNAIMAGLLHAEGDFVVIMDDDLQHSPADVPVLVEKCKNGFDVCYGLFIEKKQSLLKNAGSMLNGYLAELFLRKPRNLYLSPFKVIQGSLIKDITEYRGTFPYVDGIILSLTSNITQIELTHHRRHAGKGNYSLFRSVSVFLKHVTGYSLYPLRIATLMGLIASSFSFLLGAYFLIDYVTNSAHVEGWITLVLLLVFFNGLILMCLGLIGEYIGRIYLTVTHKPPFVIDKIVNKNTTR